MTETTDREKIKHGVVELTSAGYCTIGSENGCLILYRDQIDALAAKIEALVDVSCELAYQACRGHAPDSEMRERHQAALNGVGL